MPDSAPRLLVLYGSQTGNAQDVAERVAREARLQLFSPAVMPMDAYPVQHLPEERFAVFVAATTGQGDPPDNMRRFWKLLLRKSLPATALSGMHFAVFGLGDSGYVKFNVAAKKLDRRLEALGATPLLERGLGDDQHPSGYEASLDPWLQRLWVALRQHCPLPPGVQQPVLDEAALLQLPPAKFKLTFLPGPPPQQQQRAAASDASCSSNGDQPAKQQQCEQSEQQLIEQAVAAAAAFRAVAAEAAGMPASSVTGSSTSASAGGAAVGPWRPFMAPLLVNQRLTAADHWQETRHLEFGLQGSGLEDVWAPGDLLAIFPRTPAADVEAALVRLGLDGDAWVRIEAAAAGSSSSSSTAGGQEEGAVPAGGSSSSCRAVCEAPVRAVLQGVLDLSGCAPRRYLFQVLSHFTPHELQQQRLQYFATAEGRDDLYRYNQRERRSLLEVLQDFPAAAPPLERLLECAPLLGPRLFSIASAPAAHSGRAAVLMAVVNWTTPTRRQRKGLLTNWLARLPPVAAAGDVVRVPVWVERGALRLPPSNSTPLLLVGPGTGVAPFRSFLWQRAAIKQQQERQQEAAAAADRVADSSCLFFGCRSPSADFYYAAEWGELLRAQVLQQRDGLQVAFSRHSPQPGQQQLLDMLQQAAAVQLSGASNGSVPPASNGAAGAAAAAGDGAGQPVGSSSSSSSRVYVTDKIRQQGAMVWRLLSELGGVVYVSGSAEKMPAGVVAALEEVAVDRGGLSPEAAARFIRQLELTGRCFVEAWS